MVATDEQLVARFREGDPEVFAELYRRHHARVYATCRRRLSPTEAEDAAQETFARAFDALPTFQGGSRIGHWLVVVAKNVSIDLLRHRGRFSDRDFDLESVVEVGDGPDTATERRATQVGVRRALASLHERDRLALLWHEVDGRPLSEIAPELGLTHGSTKVMLHRARARLRAACRTEGVRGVPLWGSPFGAWRRGARRWLGRRGGAWGSVPSRAARIAITLAAAATMAAAPSVAGRPVAPPVPTVAPVSGTTNQQLPVTTRAVGGAAPIADDSDRPGTPVVPAPPATPTPTASSTTPPPAVPPVPVPVPRVSTERPTEPPHLTVEVEGEGGTFYLDDDTLDPLPIQTVCVGSTC